MREIYETEYTQMWPVNLSFITHSFIIVSSCSKSISEMALMYMQYTNTTSRFLMTIFKPTNCIVWACTFLIR